MMLPNHENIIVSCDIVTRSVIELQQLLSKKSAHERNLKFSPVRPSSGVLV